MPSSAALAFQAGRSEAAAAARAVPPRLVVDRADQCAWLGARKVALAPKAFGVLQHLAERRGRLVTKDELLDSVWPGVFVGDAVLKVAVREIRATLHDDVKAPAFIETAHRRGYRFIGEVEVVDSLRPTPSRPFRIIDGGSRATHDAPPVPVVAGREGALALLRRRLAEALDGRRQTVFVAGETGIGKTALIDAFLDESRGRSGVVVARGASVGLAGPSEPYFAVLDALGQLLRPAERLDLLAVLRRYAPSCLLQMPSLVDPSEREELEREARNGLPGRMLREIVQAIDVMAEHRPLVLVLEDLQWSDAETVSLLGALATRRSTARLLVLASFRPDALPERHPLRVIRHELLARGAASDVPLDRLDASAVGRLVESRLHGAVPAGLAGELHARSDGNPLFVVHLLDHALATGLLRRTAGGWTFDGSARLAESGLPSALRAFVDRRPGSAG